MLFASATTNQPESISKDALLSIDDLSLERTTTFSPCDRRLRFADFVATLQMLIREPSVVGTEDSFFRVVRRELEEAGAQVSYFQGALVAQGSDPHHLILSAHLDRHGLLCTGPNEFQYAAFIAGNQSELTGDSVSEQMMYTIQDRFRARARASASALLRNLSRPRLHHEVVRLPSSQESDLRSRGA